ncbi:MAG: endonuclease MutS2 [Oscillospiraceae bacterium]|jgi:DNA mismatch repair protein MutS2
MDMKSASLRTIGYDEIRKAVSARCVTAEAKEAALSIAPETDYEEAEKLSSMCAELTELIDRSSYPPLTACDGAEAAVERAHKGGMLSMGELLTVRAMLLDSSGLKNWYGASEGPCEKLFFGLLDEDRLPRDIDRAILSETEMSDEASRELSSIRKKIRSTEAGIRTSLEKIIKAGSSYLQDSVVTVRNGRYVVPVKNEYRQQVQGMIHDVSSSGATIFVEPASVVEANNQITYLKHEEQREIDRILTAFTERVAALYIDLRQSYEKIVKIDLALAKARYSIELKGTVPRLNRNGEIDLRNARHPLIPSDRVVPINIRIGGGTKQLIVTGPNTGGKTVSLKTAGLLCAMASSGMLIPASEESSAAVFSGIYADIGDEQDISQSLSTFSGHIRNIARILDEADSNSLVLLDELGAGTDPTEGAALAQAILEHLLKLGCTVMATTHYAEIKIYAVNTPGVENASCEFDSETLSPTYRLLIGTPGKSNALIISRKLGLDPEIIESAEEHIDTGAQKFEDALGRIETLENSRRSDMEAAAAARREAEQILADAREKAKDLKRKSEGEYRAVTEKARRYSAEISSDAERLYSELRNISSSKDVSKADRVREIARKESFSMDEHLPKVQETKKEHYPKLRREEIKPGLTAYSTDTGRAVTVISYEEGQDTVEVSAGNMRLRVRASSLRRMPQHQAANKPSRSAVSVTGYDRLRDAAGSELNIIGLDTVEARDRLDAYLDKAMMGNLDEVSIIHGMGTGALRKMVEDFLRHDKRVKGFRPGRYGEGGAGVTVVQLKR